MFTILLAGVMINAASAFGSLEGTRVLAGSRHGAQPTSQQLERLDEMTLKRLVANRHGKALLINVWATWCGPCVEEFPDLVRLADEMKNENIDFVGVSGDDFDDELSKVIPFISREKALFKFYIAKLEGEDKFIEAFDRKWGGGIPATFIYDSHGQKRGFLLGKQTYQSLRAAAQAVIEN